MKVVIIGAGDGGEVVADILSQYQEYEIVGFLDDNKELHGKEFSGVKVLGKIDPAG